MLKHEFDTCYKVKHLCFGGLYRTCMALYVGKVQEDWDSSCMIFLNTDSRERI